MRTARVVSGALVIAVIGLLPVAAPSDAAVPASHDRGITPSTSTTKVHVGAKIRKKDGALYMVGTVKPAKGPIIISKATKCNKATGVCNFEKYKEVGLKKGRYITQVKAPDHGSLYWQARTGSNKSQIWVTCKTTTGSCSS